LALKSPAQVDNYRGFVFASFDLNTPSLDDYLAGAREYLDLVADQSEMGMKEVAGQQSYSVRANWKLLVENSLDA
jgi:p-cumate 2,3-dioxygenase subunit alpha